MMNNGQNVCASSKTSIVAQAQRSQRSLIAAAGSTASGPDRFRLQLIFDTRHGFFGKAKIKDLAWRDFFGDS